jgi:hypothetical protein
MTGEDGLVNMSTYGFAGAPAVKYKLIVTKTMTEISSIRQKSTRKAAKKILSVSTLPAG